MGNGYQPQKGTSESLDRRLKRLTAVAWDPAAKEHAASEG